MRKLPSTSQPSSRATTAIVTTAPNDQDASSPVRGVPIPLPRSCTRIARTHFLTVPTLESLKERGLARAIRCAVDIREMTNKLPVRVQFETLREGGVAVSTGVNLAPLFVGRFGPNSNFTGFSSGMNNTARLQGCAGKNEILVMEEAIAALPGGHEFSFSDTRSAPVKNVAEPLRFRALR